MTKVHYIFMKLWKNKQKELLIFIGSKENKCLSHESHLPATLQKHQYKWLQFTVNNILDKFYSVLPCH